MRNVLLTLAVLALLNACGDDSGPTDLPDLPGVTADAANDLATTPDIPDEPDETTPSSPFPEDFIISFVYKGIIPNDNTDKSDLYIVDSKGRNPMAPSVKAPLALTTFAIDPNECQLVMEKMPDGSPLTTAPCSCNLGCVVDDSLTWIAVTVEKPSATGFAFQVGKFNADLEVKMVKGAIFKQIADIEFTGGYLYFSQAQFCTEIACQYMVFRYNLENLLKPESQFLIPPDEDKDWQGGQATTDGHFVAASDGETLAFVSPTIRSARVYVWRKGTLKELDYLCPGGMQNGNCTGSGSEFSDVDPLALSHNGKKLAWFPQSPDGLELRFYDTDIGTVQTVTLMDTTGKDYNVESCTQIEGTDWKFNEVKEPRFARDDSGLLFIARSHCDPTKRAWTDIVELPVSTIANGVLKEHTIKNITNIPRKDDIENTVIETFDLSPKGGNVAYAASPIYDEEGKQLSAASANAKKSRELWVASTTGSERQQITYNSKFSATWLKALSASVAR